MKALPLLAAFLTLTCAVIQCAAGAESIDDAARSALSVISRKEDWNFRLGNDWADRRRYESNRIKAETGDQAAQCDVAFAYQTATGVKFDLPSAIHWYQKATSQGSARALFHLGQFSTHGTGMKADPAAAAAAFLKGAEKGDVYCQAAYAFFAHLGFGTPRDTKAAQHWIQKAMAQSPRDVERWLLAASPYFGEGLRGSGKAEPAPQ